MLILELCQTSKEQVFE